MTETTAPESPVAAPAEPPTFLELGAAPDIAQALADIGIERAFPIQSMTLPLALDGQDLIGQAKTGTGKTLGFGIPLIQRIERDNTPGASPQALVVVPTRELCVQVAGDLQQASARRDTRVLSVYGGRAYEPQVTALATGIEVVVGTPGRLIDLVQRRSLDLSRVRVLVLDEADEMLDMGFLPDVERLVAELPAQRQTMLFSATMPGQIVALARRYMQQPVHIRAAEPGDDRATVDAIEQHVWRAHPMDKVELLARVLQADGRGLTMVFTRTKRKAQKIADELTDRGFAVATVHGDLGQGARERALRAFRNGKVDVLVATDVAARGIETQILADKMEDWLDELAGNMAKRDRNLPSQTGSGEVQEFLDKLARTPAVRSSTGRGRLLFAMDATASREPSWDRACHIQGEMFQATDGLGGLEVQLIYFRGFGECKATR